MHTYDCIIIGGGPAGLSAAIYMARFNRSVIVIDRGGGRACGNQINQNYLGFPKGIKASKLLELGKEQAKGFGVKIREEKVESAEKKDGIFAIQTDKELIRAKTVILATGVSDHYPVSPGFQDYIGISLFWCIVCDGYKVKNKKIVVVGNDDKSTVTAAEFLIFTKDITFLTNCDEGCDNISESGFARLKKAGIKVVYGSIKKVHGTRGKMKKVELDSGETVKAEYMFNKQGYTPNNHLAVELCAVIEGEGFIKVDHEQKTSVDGLYAAGDVTSESSHQIVTAAHEGSIAAISANEYLLEDFQK